MYLELEQRFFKLEHFYLAQIAAEIRRANVKNPSNVKTEDFIIKFKENVNSKITKEDGKILAENAKIFFRGLLGSAVKKPNKNKMKRNKK